MGVPPLTRLVARVATRLRDRAARVSRAREILARALRTRSAILPAAAAALLSVPAIPSPGGPMGLSTALRAQEVVAIRAGTLIDGTGAEPVTDAVILIRDGRIEQVGTDVRVPADAREIDLSAHTVLPGFIDTHVHLTGPVLDDPRWRHAGVTESMAAHALHGAAYARRTLEAGFTTVRNLGSPQFTDIALRDAVAEGLIPGPRILASGPSFGITGGHCDELAGYAFGVFPEDAALGVADGVDGVTRAVRRNHRYGADVIKICATGGVLSPTDSVGVQQYTDEEMRAVVEAAEMVERRVAAHAHGNEGIKAAVRAGVHSIEHGSILDDEAVRMMRERGTYLVPTLMAAEAVERLAPELPPNIAEKALYIAPVMRRSFRMAVEGGVPVALGTDSGVSPHGENGREFTLMVEHGMTPMQAIVAGTSAAADLLGLAGEVGVLAPGAHADVVAVRGDPLSDVSRIEEVDFVMKGGVVHVRDGRSAGVAR